MFDALERITAEGVIDQAVAEGLVSRASALARIDELTEREREVLARAAEGLTNRAIADRLVGDPRITSPPGRGTIVAATLPLTADRAPTETDPGACADDQGTMVRDTWPFTCP
jgi:hypothetical protein